MQRESKWRCWIKENDKWTMTQFQHRSTFWAVVDDPKSGFVDPEDFTGLKDKNGKEIWEGDILKNKYCIGDICFENGGFVFIYKANDKFKHFENLTNKWAVFCEVVGNIHENMHLLEDKENLLGVRTDEFLRE